MKQQINLKFSGKERKKLESALLYINEKTEAGPDTIGTDFTKRAKELQKEYHSSISILKKLRQTKIVKPYTKIKI